MGEHDQPSRLLLNGVSSSESTRSVVCVLNVERWLMAEERTTELIAYIQPNRPSEERRNAVADYVQRLIIKCFPCQVFTFGSVPLKTYLPDGDIDLSVFSNNPNLKDTWATLVRDTLEDEERNQSAEFCVKEVQYIHAEVKIIKCLVETIVVDISFNQLGGLCTLCFLEEIDHLINQNHIFKRSIILIKAWCYYESRILGAHHGLISTYALETLVLYIFHIFNNSFVGPLEVLYRFLEFFNNFDWDQFCVSLWGPIPISSLPDFTPYPPRKDCAELLLTRGFLDKCNAAYADFPIGQESHGQPFISKHFNIIDPLRLNNNLGRSVSKGNFFRIRSAFAFGAKRLARLLYCPQEDIVFELDQFFFNTWERHGSGIRPDAPSHSLKPLNVDQSQGLIKNISISSRKKKKKGERSFGHEYVVENTTSTNDDDVPFVRGGFNQTTQADRSQRRLNMDDYIQGKYLFARTRSSPELTEPYTYTLSQGRPNKKAIEINGKSGSVSTQTTISSVDDTPIDFNSLSNSYIEESRLGMLQEEHDLVNMMMSSSMNNLPLVGYDDKNMTRLVPDNLSFVDPSWASNLAFPPYFYGTGLSSKFEEQVNENLNPAEIVIATDADDKHPSTSNSSGFAQSIRHSGKSPSKITKDKKGMKSTTNIVYGKGKHISEPDCIQNESGDFNPSERSSVVYLPRHMLLGGLENPFTFYPTSPPIPYFTLLPFYSFPSEAHSSDAHLGSGSGSGTSTSTSIDDDLKEVNASGLAERTLLEQHKDILNSDFLNHWQNLQYGRSCQNQQLVYPSPIVLPLGYLPGRFPYMNTFSQVTSYGYPDVPRYRTGTGTYLPTLVQKASRERHSSRTRKSNYNYDRNEHRGDKNGNWNASKAKAASRNRNRNQVDKSSPRLYKQASNGHNHSIPSYQSSLNGHEASPMVMFYPYDDSASNHGDSPSETLDMEHVDPMGIMRSSKVAQHVMEGARARGAFEEQSFHASCSQKAYPHLQRRT